MTQTPRGRRTGRSVPAVYGGVSVLLIIGVLALALVTPPPSTPPMAAVAPAPQEQVEVERIEQTSRFGEGDGGTGDCQPGDPGCEGVGVQPTEDPAGGADDPGDPQVVESSAPGALRRCYNRGLTQSPDPQSPPCKAEVFAGDNGGATSSGVTATAIRIAIPMRGDNQETYEQAIRAFARHFESYYELYGRTLDIAFVAASTGTTSGVEGRRAWARDVIDVDPFAALEPATRSTGDIAFYRQLAEVGVVATMGDSMQGTASIPSLRGLQGVWSVFPTSEEALQAAGEVVCTALAGRPAAHGGADVSDLERVFGLLQLDQDGERVPTAPLTNRMDACGAPYVEAIATYADDASIEAALRSLREDGVTTVLCACANFQDNVSTAADRLEWTPEWFLPGFNDAGVSSGVTRNHSATTHEQLQHTFGITAQLRRPEVVSGGGRERFEEQYWYTALLEQDPDITFPEQGLTGTSIRARHLYAHYAQLLILVSGIQWAGPDLTPTAFEDALTSLRFANPGVGAAPWFQPGVGFGPSDRTFNSDYAAFWWDAPAVADTNQIKNGRMCYVAAGTRYAPGVFPSDLDHRFFDPAAGCR